MEDHTSQRGIYNRKEDSSKKIVKFRIEGIVYEQTRRSSLMEGFAFEGEVSVLPEF